MRPAAESDEIITIR